MSFLAMFVEREGAALRGPQEARAVERIDADFDNLRAAARWCVDANRPDLGFRIVAPLVDHLLARGRYEVGTWALALTEAAGADLDALFPVGLGLAALTAMEGGHLADADVLSTRALTSEAVDGGTRSWIAYSVRVLLTAAGQVRGDLRSALSTFREVADASDDQFGRAVFHFDRATIMKYGPAPTKVLGPASELEMLGLTTGCPSISAMGSMVKGWGLAADNRPTEAAEALRQSITLAMSVRNLVIAEMANRELMDVERASLNSYGETLRQFLEQNDIAQVIVTVLGMLPSLMDLEAYEAAARICGWILSTPWARSAQLNEAMRRLAEHLDEATAQAARSAGERMDLDQLVRFLTATIGEIHDSA